MNPLLRAYGKAYAGLPRAAWLIAFAAFLNRCGTMVLPFLVLYLTKERGMGEDTAGYFLSLWGLGGTLGVALSGRLCDSVGPVPVWGTTLVLAGLALFVLGSLQVPVLLGAAVFASGFFGDAFRPAMMVLLARTCPAEVRSRAIALSRLAVNFGIAAAPAIGGWLAESSYGWLFALDGATCIVGGLAIVWFAARGWLPTIEEAVPTSATPTPAQRGFFELDRSLIYLLLLSALSAVFFFQLLSTFPLHLRDVCGFDESTIGLVYALNPTLVALLEMPLVHRLRGRPALQLVSVGVLLMGVGYALLPFSGHIAWVGVALTVLTFGEMLDSPFLASHLSERAPRKAQGRVLGYYAMGFSFGFLFAPIVGTQLFTWGGPWLLWPVTGAALACVACGYYLVHRRDAAAAAPGPT